MARRALDSRALDRQSMEGLRIMEQARGSFYVKRERGGREGWVGPIRSARQAQREVDAWESAGWSAEARPSSVEVKAQVRSWQAAVKRERAGG